MTIDNSLFEIKSNNEDLALEIVRAIKDYGLGLADYCLKNEKELSETEQKCSLVALATIGEVVRVAIDAYERGRNQKMKIAESLSNTELN